jgi:hypothetical protein
MNTAPPPKPPKRDQTMGLVLIFIVALMIASALIWTGWWNLKRSADPYAALQHGGPSASEAFRLIA